MVVDTQNPIYSLYETTNLVNGKVYIGVHKETSWPMVDEYLGSGFALKRAVSKYGKDRFVRRMLCVSDDPMYIYEVEQQVVTEDFIKKETNYNLSGGGYGASVIGEHQRAKVSESNKTRHVSEETKEKRRRAMKGKPKTAEMRAKLSKIATGRKRPKTPELIARMQAARKGYKHSPETRAKMSKAAKKRTPEQRARHSEAMTAYWKRKKHQDEALTRTDKEG